MRRRRWSWPRIIRDYAGRPMWLRVAWFCIDVGRR